MRIPTSPGFPVLNLTRAVAILLAYLSLELEPEPTQGPPPAPVGNVDGLMAYQQSSVLTIGFLDRTNASCILRPLRRIFGRTVVTDNEVAILRGICRQMEWAARNAPAASGDGCIDSGTDE